MSDPYTYGWPFPWCGFEDTEQKLKQHVSECEP